MRYRNSNRFHTAYGGRFDNRNQEPEYGPRSRQYRDEEEWAPYTSQYRRNDVYGMAPHELSDINDEYEPESWGHYPRGYNRGEYQGDYQGYYGIQDPRERHQTNVHSSYQRYSSGGGHGYGGSYSPQGYRSHGDSHPGSSYRRPQGERGHQSDYRPANGPHRNLPVRSRYYEPGSYGEERWERDSRFDEKGRGIGHYRYDDPRNQMKFWE